MKEVVSLIEAGIWMFGFPSRQDDWIAEMCLEKQMMLVVVVHISDVKLFNHPVQRGVYLFPFPSYPKWIDYVYGIGCITEEIC